MHESIDVHELIRDPAARRLWMLYKAATFLPLGDALELARCRDVCVWIAFRKSGCVERRNTAT